MADFRVLTPAPRTRVRVRGVVLQKSSHFRSLRLADGGEESQICTFRHRSASRNATLRSLPRIRFVSSRDVHRRIASPNCVAELAALPRRLTLLVMLALCRARREPESSETLSSLIVSFLNASLVRVEAQITRSPPRYAYGLRGRESELFGRWRKYSAQDSQKDVELFGCW